jgi:predicted AAA+ superfamily ATPase
MIARPHFLQMLRRTLARNPVCALLGPRQCGKTTLAQHYARRLRTVHLFDLETEQACARLATPELALADLRGLVIIDEVQRLPGLFTVLRPLADRPRTPAKFLLLGSAAPALVRGVAESLAGRLGFVDLSGFTVSEVGAAHWPALWLRGAFPRAYLAGSARASVAWREDFLRTILERDLPQLGIRIAATTLRRFWLMLAHYHGQFWNGAELARSLGVSEHTVRHYLDILAGAYLVRLLPPWFESLAKRQVKSPKVYIRDSGLLHALLGMHTRAALEGHPKLGASWEGFALEQVLAVTGAHDAYTWRTHAGAELDLLLVRRGRRFGIEFKWTAAPRMTKSLHVAMHDLRLQRAWIVYPGTTQFAVHARVEALPLQCVTDTLRMLDQ